MLLIVVEIRPTISASRNEFVECDLDARGGERGSVRAFVRSVPGATQQRRQNAFGAPQLADRGGLNAVHRPEP